MRALVVPLLGVIVWCVSLAWWMADQLLAVHLFGSTHVVYFLIGDGGTVLYVGSTDDLERRYSEHTSDDEQGLEPWRRHIRTVVPVRNCRSQRQARRVERRMVRALTTAAEKGICPRLRNDIWAGRPSSLTRPWRTLWVAAYWSLGVCFPPNRWHRPNPTPARRAPVRVDEWDDWEPLPPDDDIADADIVSTSRQHVSMLALPPFRGAVPPADADWDADADTADVVPIRDRVRDAHRRHVDDTTAGTVDDTDDRVARRREQNRQAQARARARRRASQ